MRYLLQKFEISVNIALQKCESHGLLELIICKPKFDPTHHQVIIRKADFTFGILWMEVTYPMSLASYVTHCTYSHMNEEI